ncbi:MAG: hypothetical protein Q8R31_03285 [Candidatus Omnitrophota bacterium]|nr:hypothetical protein [Candidatus Omnitrophota bacterium]
MVKRTMQIKRNKIDLNLLHQNACKEMMNKFNSIKSGILHGGIKGGANEDVWISWLKNYLPKRYEINRGVVIDSKGSQSRQQDIVIFDRQYSPLIYKQEKTIFIPVECIYAVLEVKTQLTKEEIQDSLKKISSIRKLYRLPSQKIRHAGGIFPPIRRGRIYGYIVSSSAIWSKGSLWKKIAECLPTNEEEFIDGGCIIDKGTFSAQKIKKKFLFKHTLSEEQALFAFLGLLFEDIKTLATVPPWDLGQYSSFVRTIRSIRG